MSSALVSRQRGGKLLNVFEIIRFPNSGCNSTTVGNTYGVCYTATECAGLGGTSSGPCCLETSWATACLCRELCQRVWCLLCLLWWLRRPVQQ